jgi:hypothetical protein
VQNYSVGQDRFLPHPLPGCGCPPNLETADIYLSHFAAPKAPLFYISQTRHVSETDEITLTRNAVTRRPSCTLTWRLACFFNNTI